MLHLEGGDPEGAELERHAGLGGDELVGLGHHVAAVLGYEVRSDVLVDSARRPEREAGLAEATVVPRRTSG